MSPKTLNRARRPVRVSSDVAMSYQVRFETIAGLDDKDETTGLVTVDGTIIHTPDGMAAVPAGKFRGLCVRWARCRETLFDLCDKSQELSDITSLVWDHEKTAYRAELGLDTDVCGDLIIPSSMEILPAHRGKGIGLLVLWRFLDYFGDGAAIAVLKPYPLNHNEEARHEDNYLPMQYDRLSKMPVEKGVAKIGRHWKRLGFKPVPKGCRAGSFDSDEYLYLDMSCPLPSLSDLNLIARSS